MKRVHPSTRSQWRNWLARNHDKELQGIWLVFEKKHTGKPSLLYEESIEEALCFGWVDSVIRRIDEYRYCRKFTPRRDASVWSRTNRKRVQKVIREGRMTPFGLAKVQAAKKLGNWATDPRPIIQMEIPPELAGALSQNPKAKIFFDKLAPSFRKHFIGWISTAKRPETQAKRIMESLRLLETGQKLGLK